MVAVARNLLKTITQPLTAPNLFFSSLHLRSFPLPAMRLLSALSALPLLARLVAASPWREDLADYNLNVNKNANSPLEYDSERPNATYTPSPQNWRALPAYTILLDKFADGDPTNNDYFGTPYESDHRETQLRYGGDLKGLELRLDYLQGMGIKVVFMSGTPFLNMLWQADSQSSPRFASIGTHLSPPPPTRLFAPRL
jgi:alpha-1,3-glucan synthase